MVCVQYIYVDFQCIQETNMQGSFEDHWGFHKSACGTNAKSGERFHQAMMGLFTEESFTPTQQQQQQGTAVAESDTQRKIRKKCRGRRLSKKLLEKHHDMLGMNNAPHHHESSSESSSESDSESESHDNSSGCSVLSSSSDSSSKQDEEEEQAMLILRKEARTRDKQYARYVCGAAHFRNLDAVWNRVDGFYVGSYAQEQAIFQNVQNAYLQHALHGGNNNGGNNNGGNNNGRQVQMTCGNAAKVMTKSAKFQDIVQKVHDNSKQTGIINEVVHSELEILSILSRSCTLEAILTRWKTQLGCDSDPMCIIHMLRRHPITQAMFGAAVGAVHANNRIMKASARITKAKMQQMAIDTGLQVRMFVDFLLRHHTEMTDLTQNQLLYTLNYHH